MDFGLRELEDFQPKLYNWYQRRIKNLAEYLK